MSRAASIQAASTDFLPPADRFPYWADVVAQTFVPLECETPVRRDFSGNIRHRRIGRIGIPDVRASAQRVRRTRAKIAQAPSDDLIVVMQVDGRCNVGQSAHGAQLHSGEGVLVSAREKYFFEFPSAFRQLVLKLPRSVLRGASDDAVSSFRLANGPAHLLRHLAMATLDEPEDGASSTEVSVERAIGELLRSAIVPASPNEIRTIAAAARYDEAVRFIRHNLADPSLNPEAVASHVGLSTRSLSRVFAVRGQTIERSIWSCRLAAARDDLADPCFRDRTITEVAFSWGFNDTAHFSRCFSRAYGMTPGRFRLRRVGGTDRGE